MTDQVPTRRRYPDSQRTKSVRNVLPNGGAATPAQSFSRESMPRDAGVFARPVLRKPLVAVPNLVGLVNLRCRPGRHQIQTTRAGISAETHALLGITYRIPKGTARQDRTPGMSFPIPRAAGVLVRIREMYFPTQKRAGARLDHDREQADRRCLASADAVLEHVMPSLLQARLALNAAAWVSALLGSAACVDRTRGSARAEEAAPFAPMVAMGPDGGSDASLSDVATEDSPSDAGTEGSPSEPTRTPEVEAWFQRALSRCSADHHTVVESMLARPPSATRRVRPTD